MRKDPFYRTLLLCCLLFSSVARAQLQKIYLQPKAAGNGKQSQFVDSIRFIPLEIKAGIQSGTYSRIELTDNYFLILDYNGKSILVYSRQGNFIRKINYKQLGQNFHPTYDARKNQLTFFGTNKNYALTPKDQLQIVADADNPRNLKYFKKYLVDLADSTFTIKKTTPAQNDLKQALPYYGDYSLHSQITTSPQYKDSLDYELKIYRNNQLVKGFFPYNRIQEPKYLFTAESVIPMVTDTPFIRYVTRPFCDTVYKMVRDSIFPAYQVVLPLENSLPQAFFTRPFKNKTERENFERNNGWLLHKVLSFEETPRFIQFSVWYLSNYDTYVHNKQTNITYKAKNIRPDSSQYNLKLLGEYNILKKDDRYYKTQKAGDLIAFFEKNKNVAIPRELEAFLKSNPPATSPIIVEYKLKN
ncbi:6-bladed beta-propeller [Paraflavisolibacter sp. H34]|uniref:6-bladed beta-propeller n=1 Tax=Huijunlia imazamoxiresistens TaxID=3127457 RepID=UPI00301718CA